jgi:hypothetical protein
MAHRLNYQGIYRPVIQNRVVCPYTTTTRPSLRPYRYTYVAKRITSEAGIATSEFKLPLWVALFFVVLVSLAVLALPLAVAEVGVEALRVELTTAEVAGIEPFAAPCWTSKYIACRSIREKRVNISNLHSCGVGRKTYRDGLAELAGLFETFEKEARVNTRCRMRNNELARTYRYVVCEMENRYGDIGGGQVRGRREIGWLREQQDNVAEGIWYGKGGKGAEVRTRIKKYSPGSERRVMDDLPMRTTTRGGGRASIVCDEQATSSRHIEPGSAWVVS